MVYHQSNGSSTLLRDFRFCDELPTTPEPMSTEEPLQPSPPRPARLRLRCRNVSNIQASTEQFLASVAAADLPVPTIELAGVHAVEDMEMADPPESTNTALLAPHSMPQRGVSPPKTPIPELSMGEVAFRPDWSMDEDYRRPTSSHSNTSDCSYDSFYSGSRRSRRSDDGSCTSPDSDVEDPFQFPSVSKGKSKAYLKEPFEHDELNKDIKRKSRNNAPWSKAMSSHLWSVYLTYLQDPTVTPFRIGASAIPPEGVCHRVAREARRSWKGPQNPKSDRIASIWAQSDSRDFANTTPKAGSSNVYVKWPHCSSATRNHLRELCKKKDTSAVQRHRHLQSRSPTPFTRAMSPRNTTPEPFPPFPSTKDISISLTTSISTTMQSNGPLASLANDDQALPTPDLSFSTSTQPFTDLSFSFASPAQPSPPLEPQVLAVNQNKVNQNRILGSPFMARTYGPSSSQYLNSSPPLKSSHTVAPRLRSPVRFEAYHSRSLHGTQKRRADTLEEDLASNSGILRPSILDRQLFGTPLGHSRRVRSRGFSLGDEALRHRAPVIFNRSPPNLDLQSRNQPPTSHPIPSLLPPPAFDRPRLGSPFSPSSNTFPRRANQTSQATIKRGAYATMHQSRHSISSVDFGEDPRAKSRLQVLDEKLKEIREREEADQR
ncbi:hypothetical protein HYALB_00007565 [Hymenoscyphus albidus]|uniref:Uncharacterized protein n=1 Tax=Hymenoscyphus albidus TaxID=595503 RepID=A0A9N9LFG4_9HELO|nr:hypothetical protein HYALB_00007565 [Hymenoscyphus albidus]